MKLNTYLAFHGNCADAFKFYERCLGGKIIGMMKYGESPMADKSPPEMRNAVMHTRISVGDTLIMGSDSPPDRYQKPQGFSVAVNTEDPAEADRLQQQIERGFYGS